MVGWHLHLDGHESEQAPGAGDGQASPACCSPWGRKELDVTEWLNWRLFQYNDKLLPSIGKKISFYILPVSSGFSGLYYSLSSSLLSIDQMQRTINISQHLGAWFEVKQKIVQVLVPPLIVCTWATYFTSLGLGFRENVNNISTFLVGLL